MSSRAKEMGFSGLISDLGLVTTQRSDASVTLSRSHGGCSVSLVVHSRNGRLPSITPRATVRIIETSEEGAEMGLIRLMLYDRENWGSWITLSTQRNPIWFHSWRTARDYFMDSVHGIAPVFWEHPSLFVKRLLDALDDEGTDLESEQEEDGVF